MKVTFIRKIALAILLPGLVLITTAALLAQSQIDIDKRVESILSRMTLEEKITYIGGINDFFIRPIARVGIPELKMSDGPMGVHDYGPTTAYPAGIALAATWDTDLAQRVGTMMGDDARARGVHFILAPAMNIYRAPMCGRNFEYLGEEPFLALRVAVVPITAIHSRHALPPPKHLMGNTPW